MKCTFKLQFLLILLLGAFQFSGTVEQSYKITVKITNIRNSKGQMNVQLFKTSESFVKEKCWKDYVFPKGSKVVDNTLTVVIPNIPKGTYGIAILDDENENLEMDSKMFIPQEGFGFSNYYHSAWSKPKFESFKFDLNKDLNVNIKVRYV